MAAEVLDLENNEQAGGGAADAAMHAVADGLAHQGFDIRGPAWDRSRYLKITNVRGTWCEITIGENGNVSWEYRSFEGGRTDPGQITGMIMTALGAASAGRGDTSPARYPGLTLKGAVGRALADRGMQVSLERVTRDDHFFETYAEIKVTNPGKPERGQAWVTDDSVICWECQISDTATDVPGIGLEEITGTIARVLDGGRIP
jgi:hypothetical protein